jgi:hypothetical protein
MNIRWNNIVAAILGMTALIFALRHKESCEAALDSINRLGQSNSTDDRFVGFMVLGLIGVCIVAIVKILTHSRPNDHRGRRDEPPED